MTGRPSRRFPTPIRSAVVAAWALGAFLAASALTTAPARADSPTTPPSQQKQDASSVLAAITGRVLPADGFQSRIRPGDAVQKLVERGVIDPEKFAAVYAPRGGLPTELASVFTERHDAPIRLTTKNAQHYLNLLWPLGIANHLAANSRGPINDSNLFKLASTGGWTLGRKDNGGHYFNRFRIVELSADQEATVTRVARNIFRPCCNNHTMFQDCNHGSAMLGLLTLGAAQGLGEDELYREALAFNSFWFASQYVLTAAYFELVKETAWSAVDPRTVLGREFSSLGGWRVNIGEEMQRRQLVPGAGGGCGV
jgi:hypothetical protein